MSDFSKLQIDNDEYNVKDKQARADIVTLKTTTTNLSNDNDTNKEKITSLDERTSSLEERATSLEKNKQDNLIAGDNAIIENNKIEFKLPTPNMSQETEIDLSKAYTLDEDAYMKCTININSVPGSVLIRADGKNLWYKHSNSNIEQICFPPILFKKGTVFNSVNITNASISVIKIPLN